MTVPEVGMCPGWEFASFPVTPRSPPPAADAGCSTKELKAFASSTPDIPVGSSLFSVELRPEPTAEKKAVNNRLIPSPSPRPLPKGEGEPLGSSGRSECAKAFGRAGDVELPGRRASVRGIEVDIPRALTKRSHVRPLPGGEGGVRGKALFDSPSRLPSFKSLLFHRIQGKDILPKLICAQTPLEGNGPR